MFPAGAAGAGLLLFRISVSAMLLIDGTAHRPAAACFWILAAFGILATMLCLGFLTPYCAALGCLVQLGVFFLASEGHSRFHLAISILNSGVLALLGPGGYSIDARIFGRRLLYFPPRK